VSEAWVIDASPLILFSRIGRLDLIGRIAPAILIPDAVIEEIRAGQAKDRTATEDGIERVAPLVAAWAKLTISLELSSITILPVLRSYRAETARGTRSFVSAARRFASSNSLSDAMNLLPCYPSAWVLAAGDCGLVICP
jgi:hypothetical protein